MTSRYLVTVSGNYWRSRSKSRLRLRLRGKTQNKTRLQKWPPGSTYSKTIWDRNRDWDWDWDAGTGQHYDSAGTNDQQVPGTRKTRTNEDRDRLPRTSRLYPLYNVSRPISGKLLGIRIRCYSFCCRTRQYTYSLPTGHCSGTKPARGRKSGDIIQSTRSNANLDHIHDHGCIHGFLLAAVLCVLPSVITKLRVVTKRCHRALSYNVVV